jgi:hypothetical protein
MVCMTSTILPTLTDDERTVLMIAARGESMIPIGRWKPTILGLAKRGLMLKQDAFNYTITDAGRAATEGVEAAVDAEMKGAIGKFVEQSEMQDARVAGLSVRQILALGDFYRDATGKEPSEICPP